LFALSAVLQVILHQGHCLGWVHSHEGDFGKVIEVIKALPASDLVRAGRDYFLDDLF
jgi:hypothetical protein